MVGWLVQKKDVGRGRQHAGKGRTARLPTRDVRGVFFAGEAKLLQQIPCLIMVVARAETGLDIGERTSVLGEVRFLRQVADRGAGLHEAIAGVGLDKACCDL